MKDFITSIAAVLILMMFVMQFAANQVSFTQIMGAEYAVREACLISENQGMIKSDSIAELKAKLAGILGCSMSEININIPSGRLDTKNEGEESEAVDVEVTMPVYGVIGPAGVLGIEPSQNVRIHQSSGTVILKPEPEPEPETEPEPEGTPEQ
ncbi:MAG: hypothetical protein IJB73_03650 [Firmicutes bacterium]|nr:hypothetical protein [Bacillota bacterium]